MDKLGDAAQASQHCLELIATQADGDARRSINLLELAADLADDGEITEQHA